MGSVKDLLVIEEPTEREMGVGRFVFSDDYSVFDRGKMPDPIPYKGPALCLMGACSFERAEDKGINTHYGGLVRSDGKIVRTDELDEPTNVMEIKLVRVIHPTFSDGKYDYSMFNPYLMNFLLPLEIIYRNGLPEGSSVFKRLEKGKRGEAGGITPEDLGLDHYPVPGERLKVPILDVSTKLEAKDRYISWEEAKRIVSFDDEEIAEIKDVLLDVDGVITDVAKAAKLVNEDGKIELARDRWGDIMVVDVIGTLDECRFTYNGTHVSKEVVRQFYRKTPWYNDVEEAKKQAERLGIENWKELCKSQPKRLDTRLKQIVSEMYTSTANAFLGRKLFDSPSLEEVVKDYTDWLADFGKLA